MGTDDDVFGELEALGRRLGEFSSRAARRAAPKVLAALKATAAAGTDPQGKAWPPLAGGGAPMQGAADAISIETSGGDIKAKIGEPWVYLDAGAGGVSQSKDAIRSRKKAAKKQATIKRTNTGRASKFHAPRRQILPGPDDPIPPGVEKALSDATDEEFEGIDE